MFKRGAIIFFGIQAIHADCIDANINLARGGPLLSLLVSEADSRRGNVFVVVLFSFLGSSNPSAFLH